MERPIIGIVSQKVEGEKGRIFFERTSFSTVLAAKLSKQDAFPYGLVLNDNVTNEDYYRLFDGFVFQGGNKINAEQIMAMHYAIRSGKPILGICMGMQTMAAYDYLYRLLNGNIVFEDVKRLLRAIDETYYLTAVSGHNKCDPFYIDDVEKSLHRVDLEKNCELSKIYGDHLDMPSVHNCAVCPEAVGNLFTVKGKTRDDVIEVLEGNGVNAIGVQFHPEIIPDGDTLFENFANAARLVRHK